LRFWVMPCAVSLIFFRSEGFVIVVVVVVVSCAPAGAAATSARPTVPIAIRVLARLRSGSAGVSMWVRVFMGHMVGHGNVAA
jgi:hypothetical protein